MSRKSTRPGPSGKPEPEVPCHLEYPTSCPNPSHSPRTRSGPIVQKGDSSLRRFRPGFGAARVALHPLGNAPSGRLARCEAKMMLEGCVPVALECSGCPSRSISRARRSNMSNAVAKRTNEVALHQKQALRQIHRQKHPHHDIEPKPAAPRFAAQQGCAVHGGARAMAKRKMADPRTPKFSSVSRYPLWACGASRPTSGPDRPGPGIGWRPERLIANAKKEVLRNHRVDQPPERYATGQGHILAQRLERRDQKFGSRDGDHRAEL